MTTKIKKEKKPDRNHDQVDTDVPRNYQNSERRYIYDPLPKQGERETNIFGGGRETRGGGEGRESDMCYITCTC